MGPIGTANDLPPLRTVATISLISLMLTGCADFLTLYRTGTEIACVSQCMEVKERCDADARWDYRQCETRYAVAQHDYLWCNASDEAQCGYPWWSCSQNLYGYCTNRYRECQEGCRQTGQQATGAVRPKSPGKPAHN